MGAALKERALKGELDLFFLVVAWRRFVCARFVGDVGLRNSSYTCNQYIREFPERMFRMFGTSDLLFSACISSSPDFITQAIKGVSVGL